MRWFAPRLFTPCHAGSIPVHLAKFWGHRLNGFGYLILTQEIASSILADPTTIQDSRPDLSQRAGTVTSASTEKENNDAYPLQVQSRWY